MNLFSGLLGRGAALRFDTQGAVMAPVVAAMLADGRIEDEELLQIEATCMTSPIFERNSSEENRRLIMRSARLIEDHGTEAVCRGAAGVLTAPLRETAFTYAAQVIFSDGYVDPFEREMMEALAGMLSIDLERARNLIDIVSVMHHPATA